MISSLNKGLYTSMAQFDSKTKENGKSTLGTGSFGQVVLVQHTKSKSLFAVKVVIL